MKKLLTLLTVAALVFTVNAGTLFDDDFTVTGGGDVNFEYDQGRQTGTLSPILYNWANGPSTVTNGGPNAGQCHMAAAGANPPAYLNIAHNFTESGDFSLEYEITRLEADNANWDAVSLGTDAPYKYPHETPLNYGFEVIFFEHGWYHVYMPGQLTGNFFFAELQPSVTPTLKIRFVVSQADFSGTGDARIAMFINDKPYPLINGDGGTKYSFDFPGGFTNNYISWLTLDTDVNMDNIKVLTPPGNVINTAQWTDDADSAISGTKSYTHAISLGNSSDVTINSVLFTGTGATNIGANWEVRTDTGAILPAVETTGLGLIPNVTGQSQFIITNGLYDLTAVANPALTLTGLTPDQQYILTLYSQGFGGPSYAYVATSDGIAITVQDSSEYGVFSGERMTYHYTAPDSGIFSISTTGTNGPWGLFAFSNEVIPEPGLIIACISLIGLAFLRKK